MVYRASIKEDACSRPLPYTFCHNRCMENPGDNLTTAMRRTAARYRMFTAGETVVVAVSGGPDSTALLHALAALCTEWDVRLVGAHLHHGFRGDEATGDAEYVEALCRRLTVPFYGERTDVPALRRRRHLSAQVAAREVRHAFLRRIANEVGASRIALGHTRDDRIETVLLNILRGAGLDGLAGPAASEPPLIRPLLEVSRAETAAYCAMHALSPRQDSSNANTDYRRNRVRAELLPHLASYYNQCVSDSLLRLSDLAAADSALLNELASEAIKTVTLAASDSEWVLAAAELGSLPLAMQRRVLRLAVAAVRGEMRDVGMEPTERILNALACERDETALLPFGPTASVEISKVGPTVRIRRLAPSSQRLPWQCVIDIPGDIEVPQAALFVEAIRTNSLITAPSEALTAQNRLIYRAQEIVLPLTMRSWQPGDRMRPRGLGGTKKLQDLFTDRKISGEERLRFPVLVDASGRILAVIGVQADETALRPFEKSAEDAGSGDYIVLSWK